MTYGIRHRKLADKIKYLMGDGIISNIIRHLSVGCYRRNGQSGSALTYDQRGNRIKDMINLALRG
jgi:hypothetical protein